MSVLQRGITWQDSVIAVGTLSLLWGVCSPLGTCGSVVVEALSYTPEGRGIASNLPNPSGRTVALGSTHSVSNKIEYQEP
jgi:hypothetical protein